jgi:cytochrome P450
VSHRAPEPRGRDDAIGRMLHVDSAVERLSHAEIQSLVLQMMLIPNNLTIHLLGEVAAHVLSNPRLRAELRARGSAAHEVIGDILLSRPPQQRVSRRTVEPCTLHGRPIPAKSGISVALHAHPTKHGTPQPRNLAFGQGPHSCAGAAIASMQAEAVAQELSREEGLRITSDGFQRDSDGSSTVPVSY